MSRCTRTERRPGVRLTLTDRDRAVLSALGRFGVAPTAALAAVAFPGVSRQAVSRRLRRLHDSAYVSARAPVLAGPNFYVLAARGRDWAREQGLEPVRVPRALPHRLAVIETWIGIAHAAGDCGAQVRKFTPEWEMDAMSRTAIVPDAIADFVFPCAGGPPHLVRLLVEVDLSTEPVSVIHRKLERYALLAAASGSEECADPVVAFALFGASTRRVSALSGLLSEVWPGRAVLWTGEDGPAAVLAALREAVVAGCCNGCNRETSVNDELSNTPGTEHSGY